MKKLIEGIIQFRKNARPEYRQKFAQLALGQSPDALFIACSDSRVVPNLFASTDPGDLFVVRNVGNLIPTRVKDGCSTTDNSEAAAIEFAVSNLKVSDIIVCGHSDCGAMRALLEGREKVTSPELRGWLQHGEGSLTRLKQAKAKTDQLNQLSRINVLEQLDHLKSYSVVREGLAKGRLKVHGWWFDLITANVFFYDAVQGQFVLIGEGE